MDVKICDFGLAAQLLGHDEKRKTTCGTPNYLAPEVFDKTNGYSYSVDIWAVGIIFYIVGSKTRAELVKDPELNLEGTSGD